MGIKDELLYDFSLNMPRILISGKTGIVDNVKKLVMVSENNVVADCGAMFASVSGEELTVDLLDDKRMIVTGTIRNLEIYPGKKEEKQRNQKKVNR